MRLVSALLLLSCLTSNTSVAAAQASSFSFELTRRAGPLAEAAVREGLLSRKLALLACLQAGGDAPSLRGARVKLRVMVASDGAVVVAAVQEARGRSLESCVEQALSAARFRAHPAFTTFIVELRLGDVPTAEPAPPAVRGRAQLTLLLTRVRGELRPSSARRGFIAAKERLRRCYAQAVARGASPSLRLHLVVRVDASGQVLAVGESAGQELSEPFERCLERALRRQGFAAPSSGEAEIQQSLRFAFTHASE